LDTDNDGVDECSDCNDADVNTYPGATEIVGDGIDQDCNATEICYVDVDNDGYHNGTTLESNNLNCNDAGEAGISVPGGDCNDSIASINPDAIEICEDGVDNDCDGEDSVSPQIGLILAPSEPIPVNSSISISADFTDPNINDVHTETCEWGDGTVDVNNLDQGIRSVADNHTYSTPGIHTVTLTVSDDYCGNDSAIFQYIVVYDPMGGFVTGGGWINSQEGAYVPDPLMTGKANFGFVSKYKKGSTVPTGNTEFQFNTAGLNFHSDNYQWLVVTGSNYARFMGEGMINHEGNYKFMLWAGDGTGAEGTDTFRIKIWTEDEETTSETVIYDNGFDQVIEGGSIVVHTRKK
jgi:PKD repeat protein